MLGSKPILLGSIFTGVVGSFMYGSAAFCGTTFGPWLGMSLAPSVFIFLEPVCKIVFVGRFLQGIWTGGQQSVETGLIYVFLFAHSCFFFLQRMSARMFQKTAKLRFERFDETRTVSSFQIITNISTFACMGFVLGPGIQTNTGCSRS